MRIYSYHLCLSIHARFILLYFIFSVAAEKKSLILNLPMAKNHDSIHYQHIFIVHNKLFNYVSFTNIQNKKIQKNYFSQFWFKIP